MDDSSRIWLITNDGARRERWRCALNVPECRVLDAANVANERVDVIVADRPLVAAEIAAISTSAARGHAGLIAVGWRGAADVNLGVDSTDRELRLACGLLGRIVQQRRAMARQSRELELLRHLALSDPLTGLANRRAWDDEFPRRLAAAESAQNALCLALLDLDQLKALNEVHGHEAGDQQLRAVARALTAATSPGDLVVRLGGDEFAVLFATCEPGPSPATMPQFREQLDELLQRGRLAEPTGKTGDPANRTQEISPSVSIGWVVISPGQSVSPNEWFARADRALRAAKRRGRAQSVGYSTELEQGTR